MCASIGQGHVEPKGDIVGCALHAPAALLIDDAENAATVVRINACRR